MWVSVVTKESQDTSTPSVHVQVEHPEVGKQFEGLPEGERRYVLNAYMQHKYPTC